MMIDKKPANKIKLNRSQIREGLKQIPIESIIMGEGKKKTLTTKQRGFIKDVAMGKTKAQAYRDNYNTRAKPKQAGTEGCKLSAKPIINAEIEAFRLALEAQAHYEGANLKALILHQLTIHALSPDTPPATRVRALELLGKSYDVGLFVERKEITTINNSFDAKNKLMKQLKDALSRNAITVDYSMTGESLLDEIKGTPTANQSAEPQTHRTPTPQIDRTDTPADTHSIPHTKSPQIDAQPIDSIEEKEQVVTLPHDINDINIDAQVIDSEEELKDGVGVSISTEEAKGEDTETPPRTVWTEKG
jgi:hypothetical protein